jgi:hypothetical protein
MKKQGSGRAAAGLQTMHQGTSTKTRGTSSMAGNTRGIMAQGKTKKHAPPVGKLPGIMGQ